MRILLGCLLCVAACGTDEPPEETDPCANLGHTATVLAPTGSTSPSLAQVMVQWSPAVPGRYLQVRDPNGSDFTSEDAIVPASDMLTASYQLPAGRMITVEAGFTCEATSERRALATKLFMTMSTLPCDTPTVGYAATITRPVRDAVLPAGLAVGSTAFTYSFMPTTGIPDRYESVYDETAGHVQLSSAPGYDLPAGHTFTLEVGWFCLDETPEKAIPLAAVRFSTAP